MKFSSSLLVDKTTSDSTLDAIFGCHPKWRCSHILTILEIFVQDFQADVHIFQHIQPTSEIQHVCQGTHLQLHQVQNSPRPHSSYGSFPTKWIDCNPILH